MRKISELHRPERKRKPPATGDYELSVEKANRTTPPEMNQSCSTKYSACAVLLLWKS
jgi:hypothetical protein